MIPYRSGVQDFRQILSAFSQSAEARNNPELKKLITEQLGKDILLSASHTMVSSLDPSGQALMHNIVTTRDRSNEICDRGNSRTCIKN